MDASQRNPFFLPLVAVVAGMAGEVSLPGEAESYWPALLLVPLLAIYLAGQESGNRVHSLRWACNVSLFLAGGLWLSLHPLPSPPLTNATPGERVEIEGCVDSSVRRSPERLQFMIALDDGSRVQASIYPRDGESAPSLRFGQVVRMAGRIRPPRNFQNPASFDYERFLARQNVFWLLSATGVENLQPGDEECGSTALAVLHRIQDGFLAKLRSRFAEQTETRAWLSAILMGDDSEIPEETLESYRLAGVYHVLVISGQHIAILAGAILLFVRLFPIPRWTGFLFTVVSCWAYALVSGYEVPAVRAACGITLYLAGSLAYRRARPLNLVSLIALAFLAWDPGQILDASFQLSFIAVLAIAGIAAPLQRYCFGNWAQAARRLGDIAIDLRLPPPVAEARVELRLLVSTIHLATRFPNRLCRAAVSFLVHAIAIAGSLVLISLVVQAVLTPLLVQDFHRAPLSAPLTNLLLSPILGLLVPFAFADLFFSLPGGQSILAGAVHFTNGLVAWVAAHTPDLRVPDVPPLVLMLATALVVSAILAWEPLARMVSARERRNGPPEGAKAKPRIRILRWSTPLLGAAASATLLLILGRPFPAEIHPGELELTMLDVGQGDANFIVTPGGSTILIDTGGLGAYSATTRLDTGEDIVAPYLWHRGFRRIDVLILSHLDFDHAGGAPAILRSFRPRALWLPIFPSQHQLWDRVSATAADLGIQPELRSAGDTWEVDGVQFEFHHPGPLHPTTGKASADSNGESLVLHLRFGKNTALFTGDIERVGEFAILSRGTLPHADVLKVAHHGSRTSTTEEFLSVVAPSVALISAGWLNPYRHPHPTVVDRILSRRTAIFRTDRDGAITLRSDGRRWSNVERE